MKPEHPGTIVFVDGNAGTEETRDATAVPEGIRFARTDGGWVPVVRVVKDRSGDRVEIKSYDAEGRLVSTTIGHTGKPAR